jgi:putative membrane protein
MGGWMGFWWVLIFLAIAVLGGFVLNSSRGGGERGDSPERVLKRRYASGEIDRETYERMLEDLRK